MSHPSSTSSDISAHNHSKVTPEWLSDVAFNSDGLIPAIAQDHKTNTILMMAWMNAEALQKTVESNTAVYFSRSRGKLWHKGETSGHTQMVHDIYLDCDSDVIILSVTQIGGIACHTGRQSCFYRRLDISTSDQPQWQTVAPVLKDPEEIYNQSKSASPNGLPLSPSSRHDGAVNKSEIPASDAITVADLLTHLDAVLQERKTAAADSSYVASLYSKGINKILEKVGEESVETIIAAKDLATTHQLGNAEDIPKSTDDLIYEIADLWFHTMVTLAWFNLDSQKILLELARRFGLSGIDEKNNRTA